MMEQGELVDATMNDFTASSSVLAQREMSLLVGGDKGHEEERVSGPLLELYQTYKWKPIPKCTGRYTCRDHEQVSLLSPVAVLKEGRIQGAMPWKEYCFRLPGRSDEVVVLPMDLRFTVGMISYVKATDVPTRYVHTLNTPSGFQRKLQAIGLRVNDGLISKR